MAEKTSIENLESILNYKIFGTVVSAVSGLIAGAYTISPRWDTVEQTGDSLFHDINEQIGERGLSAAITVAGVATTVALYKSAKKTNNQLSHKQQIVKVNRSNYPSEFE